MSRDVAYLTEGRVNKVRLEYERSDVVGGQWKIVHQPSGHVTSGLPSYKDAEQLVKQRQRECGASTSFLPKYYKTLIDGTVITTN